MHGGQGGGFGKGVKGSGRGTLGPVNIVELLKAQQQSLLKGMDEEQREKFLQNGRIHSAGLMNGGGLFL